MIIRRATESSGWFWPGVSVDPELALSPGERQGQNASLNDTSYEAGSGVSILHCRSQAFAQEEIVSQANSICFASSAVWNRSR